MPMVTRFFCGLMSGFEIKALLVDPCHFGIASDHASGSWTMSRVSGLVQQGLLYVVIDLTDKEIDQAPFFGRSMSPDLGVMQHGPRRIGPIMGPTKESSVNLISLIRFVILVDLI
eukprot:TRINITY_DN1033_c0_g3_i1.p1 TRINITY_DN1033_c0_g3~~TRINITY_DN1033_c0_g3_i1.p1  ORF type:complete len:115 (-),score=14.13 TRINITY_DN1033_c0_g3_i1:1333-1677(-)